MAEVRVRNLKDDVKLMLRDQARHRGQNLEAYLRAVLEEAAVRPRRELAGRLEAFRAGVEREHGLLSDSAAGIREDRDARG
jgi:plasmid stability protein